jgi:hypothetical protein
MNEKKNFVSVQADRGGARGAPLAINRATGAALRTRAGVGEAGRSISKISPMNCSDGLVPPRAQIEHSAKRLALPRGASRVP